MIGCFIASDVIGTDSGLFIGRSGQRYHCSFTCNVLGYLDYVTHGIYIFGRGFQKFVYYDAAGFI